MKRLFAVAVSALMLASGCSRHEHALSHRRLVIALAEPTSMNPLYLEGLDAYEFGELGFSYLTNYGPDYTIVPDVAREVPTMANGGISRDGKTIVYHLRRGVVWQDGAPLTARDVVFTYRAVVNPRNSVRTRYPYDQIVSVSAADSYTVLLKLKEPFSPMISWFLGGDSNYPILPAHLLARYSSLDRIAYNDRPIGSGPFQFGEWLRGDRVSFTANARYYAGTPGLDGIDVRFIPDASTVVNQLFTGEVDATFFADVSKIETLRKIPGHRIVVTPVPYVVSLDFNMRDPVTSDAIVRRAFSEAIDRHVLVDKTTHGLYDAGTGLRGIFAWAYDPSAGNVPYDPAAAAKMLQSDGWIAGPDGIRVKNGRRLEIQIADYTGTQVPLDAMATVVAAQERAVGIDVSMKRYSVQEAYLTTGPIKTGHYQVFLEQYQASGDPDVSWMLDCDQQPPNGFNTDFYCNRDVDAALARGRAEYARTKRVRMYAYVQRQLLRDLPFYLVAQVGEVDVVPTWLQGYGTPFLSPFVSIARWHSLNTAF